MNVLTLGVRQSEFSGPDQALFALLDVTFVATHHCAILAFKQAPRRCASRAPSLLARPQVKLFSERGILGFLGYSGDR